ncbi:MAG: recombination protein RecR [Caldiserica bacterium]|nr:MAG: recombination protein RecR [Caldisericota bacterium]
MSDYPESVLKIIRALKMLPEIGPKMAQRISFEILNWKKEDFEKFIKDIVDGYTKTKKCKICNNFSEKEICSICEDPTREKEKLCIVEDVQGIKSIERTKVFKGRYHVIDSVIKPLEGKGVDQIGIEKIIERIKKDKIKEIIIALNPRSEREITSIYIKDERKKVFPEIKITKLARGIPLGTEIEYADELTLKEAIEGRKEI